MIFLFATLPAEERIRSVQVLECQRLSSEFMAYIVESRSLRKTFLSIRGVYYQAELMGQDITWIVPYQFSQLLPVDVDFKVMGTFLEVYITLLTFVNYKLYADKGLMYPPKVDTHKQEQDVGITAYLLESTVPSKEFTGEARIKKSVKKVSKANKLMMTTRLEALGDAMEDIQAYSDNEERVDETKAESKNQVSMDFVPTLNVDSESDDEEQINNNVTSLSQLKSQSNSVSNLTRLFEGCIFYLARETPRWSLEFVIRSFGGQVGWEDDSLANHTQSKHADLKMGVSHYEMNDQRITHHVVDRPLLSRVSDRRDYIQPQWIYDCVNARRIIKSESYQPGQTLPAHLSPFVKYEDGDYKPDGVLVEEREENESLGKEEDLEANHVSL